MRFSSESGYFVVKTHAWHRFVLGDSMLLRDSPSFITHRANSSSVRTYDAVSFSSQASQEFTALPCDQDFIRAQSRDVSECK